MISLVARKCILIGLSICLIIAIVSFDDFAGYDEDLHLETDTINNPESLILNLQKRHANQQQSHFNKSVHKTSKNKANTMSRLFKIHIDRLRNDTDKMELIFLVDASGSVGLKNFQSELNFVKNLLSDFTVEPSVTRVAIVTFGGKRNIRRNVDQISRGSENDNKCYLLNKQLNNINYTGGGTYTRGALLEAFRILEKGRSNARKVVFLITDGFSNGGDPRPAASLLKGVGATIFTFGIRTGNVDELHDIASAPGYTHSYFLNSFAEFEAFARRALHRDLKTGNYVTVKYPDNCNLLCRNISEVSNVQNCCDNFAICACGTASGHYACICPIGYIGSGFRGSCQPCPNGTYAAGEISGDSTSTCIPCPDVNHVTINVPATSVEHCVCASGFTTDGRKCEVITCPKLKIPENGYLVKASACSNVMHAACGIRCRIGFYLTGDSIQLCGKDGTWSGNEPKCLLKTCPVLRVPAHGRMRCQNEEGQHRITENTTAYPIDTRCQFKCNTGYQLRGSKIRNCLPLAQWDGLKATCKAIKCEPLKQITNGQISPKACSGPEKLPFGTNCTITCKNGFVLEGPKIRTCGGRSGFWTHRRTVNRCIDKMPPSITCPSDITTESLPGKNYAYLNWTTPMTVDNIDESPTLWSKPYITFPWKVKIGTRTVVYVSQDSSGNKARCKFRVKVVDKEPPMIEHCVDPPVFYTENRVGISNLTWDEPGFHDNSKTTLLVEQNYHPGENTFPIGLTKVVYNAIDKYNNSATCVLNVTIKDVCEEVPKALNSYFSCSNFTNETSECTLNCEKGFEFATIDSNHQIVENILLLKCNANSSSWTEEYYIPDCSESSVPKTISQEGSIVLDGNVSTVCDNQTNLRELTEYISADLRSMLLDICGNDVECNLIIFDPECVENVSFVANVYSQLTRKRRELNYYDVPSIGLQTINIMTRSRIGTNSKRSINKMHDSINRNKAKMKRKKEKIEIKFKFLGKIIEENVENPREGVQKLRQKIESMTRVGKLNLLNNKTNQEIAKLALNLHLVFRNFQELCDPGSVLKKHTCVKCPLGTFFNSLIGRCQSCPFGEYEDTTGSLNCKRCLEHTFTKRMNSKSSHDCIRICRPGYYSQKRRYHDAKFALEPCLMCDIGYYQSEYGKTHCLPCPYNTTTKQRGAKNPNDCLPSYKVENDICQTKACLNGGHCTQEEDSFSCECLDYYIGSKCERFRNPCDSSPCLNEGMCSMQNYVNGTICYTCGCKGGYSGTNCEVYIDECTVNPCKNNGTCISTEIDYSCECKHGFEGEFCENAVNYCDPSPCMEGSTCVNIDETWRCLCRPGFLGHHCNLLPCDWLPCNENSYCTNIEEETATRMSYRCECEDGYTGENCTTKVDYCKSFPCMNNGKCVSDIFNYTCVCSVPFTGRHCETELSSDYVIQFAKSGTTDFVSMKGPAMNLLELTTCLWLQSRDTFNYGTVLSYATSYYDNAFTLTDYNGLVIYINGQKVVTDIKVNDGHWHFICFTWKSENGSWNIFIDGLLRDNGTYLAKGTTVQGNGTLIIGQEQDRVGGGFSELESFLGKLTLLDIWNVVLKITDVNRMFNTCEKYQGNVIAWSQLQEHIHGDITILNSNFCRGCPLPVLPAKGNINVSSDALEITYYCNNGYIVRFHGKEYRSLRIKCLKQGQWQGYYTPVCIRRKCEFPGYFPRGRIHGRSYFFEDEIRYSCLTGYELRGNPRRICNAEGKWSGLPPICIGKTCKNLLAPENGDIEYVIEDYERDDLSILQVGQQIEFKCDLGFRLIGEKFLTCLESGVWDHDRPTCVANGCSSPKKIEHGYIISESSNNLHQSSIRNLVVRKTNNMFERNYYFNEIVEYTCQSGYKFQGNRNSLTQFKLQCIENGTWIGFVPDCIPLKCFWPSIVNNARIFLITKNNDTIELFKKQVINNTNTEITKENENSLKENESLEDQFVIGAQVLIKCNTGYKLTGRDVRVCLDNEEWSSMSSCEPRECPLVNHPVLLFLDKEMNLNNHTSIFGDNHNIKWEDRNYYNGSYENMEIFVEGYTYTKKVIFRCKNNIEIKLNDVSINTSITNITWYCNEHGEWNITDSTLNATASNNLFNRGVCQEMCNPVTIPEYGYIPNNHYSKIINSTVTFQCREGYIIEGNEMSICLANGTWSAVPFCRPVPCGKPPKLTNAALKENTVELANFTFGDIITYKCLPGYIMFGQPNARCLATGKWSRTFTKCSRLSCNKPKLPTGVTVRGRSYLYQDKLTYICPDGKKQGLIICKVNGQWSDPPVCNNH